MEIIVNGDADLTSHGGGWCATVGILRMPDNLVFRVQRIPG